MGMTRAFCFAGLALLTAGPAGGRPQEEISLHRDAHPAARPTRGIIRNLPDIKLTLRDQVRVAQETNFYGVAGVSNTTVDYGLPDYWNLGVSFLNAQFYTAGGFQQTFQPDVMLNIEKFLPLGTFGTAIIGAQTGAAVYPEGAELINFSYLDFVWPTLGGRLDLDVGAYFANEALAGGNTFGVHLNVAIPVGKYLRLTGDYLSGRGKLSGMTLKVLVPVAAAWHLGVGVQMPTPHSNNDYSGLLGIYWN